MPSFSGSYAAIVTPWTADGSKIDYDAFSRLIEWHIESGTDGIVPAGTTGESATLTHDEHDELVARTVQLVKKRCKVVAGAGSNATAETVKLVKRAAAAGADGALVITPYYNRPTPEGLYRHFLEAAAAADLPIMMYNVPSRTGTDMQVDAIARIRRACPRIVSVKEASGSADRTGRILAECDIEVMSGDDSLTLPLMALGALGVVSVAANVAPAGIKAMVKAAAAGDFAAARAEHYAWLPLMRDLFIETNPIPAKTALAWMGRINPAVRPPLCPMTPPHEDALRATLARLHLLS